MVNVDATGSISNIRKVGKNVYATLKTPAYGYKGQPQLDSYSLSFLPSKNNPKLVAQARSLKNFQTITVKGAMSRTEYERKDGMIIRDVQVRVFEIDFPKPPHRDNKSHDVNHK